MEYKNGTDTKIVVDAELHIFIACRAIPMILHRDESIIYMVESIIYYLYTV